MRKITIEDISRDTGLSRGTVSRALNDKPDISTRTKQRVLEACNRLKYVPSHAARSLATGRNYALTVLADNVQTSLNAGILRGVLRRAHASHYMVQVIETGTDSFEDSLETLSPERVDAVLITMPLDSRNARRLRERLDNRVLSAAWPLEGVPCDTFTPDFAEAGRIVARFFLRNGVHEILYLHAANQAGAEGQLNGFHEVCRENGINPEDCTAKVDDVRALDQIAARIQRARGIAATNDYLACAAQMLAMSLGRRPGEDLGIIGYGDEVVARSIHPDLTTLDGGGEEIGERMVEALLQRLGHERSENPEYSRVAPRMVCRGSTHHLKME